jgi:hypothetical protein
LIVSQRTSESSEKRGLKTIYAIERDEAS